MNPPVGNRRQRSEGTARAVRAVKARFAAELTPVERIGNRLTVIAGSSAFLISHFAWFAVWIGWNVAAGGRAFDPFPFGLLTMIVSLEAIFLSTFVMISQNRADAKRQVIADQQWKTVQEEDRQNEELLTMSNQILELTKAIHALAIKDLGGVQPGPPTAD